MTAHVIYENIDPDNIATVSEKVIEEIIRGEIGFSGILLSDDLSMKAMHGSYEERARMSLQSGCDLALHCNGDKFEMESVSKGLTQINESTQIRLEKAWSLRKVSSLDWDDTLAELTTLISPYWPEI